MLVPIRRWRAAVFGVVLVFASLSAASLSAGVVAPSENSDRLPAAQSPNLAPTTLAQRDRDVAVAFSLPLPSMDEGAQTFWYPGIDSVASTSISSVPIHAGSDLHVTPFPGTAQQPLIPLPGAAWTGMAGLLGLGAVKLLRNFRKLLA